jgi:hypothetical protein
MTSFVKPNIDRVLYLYSADAIKTINGANCEEYRWNIPEITLNDAGEISMIGKSYLYFAPVDTIITTRIKNVSTKYTIDTKRGDGAILNVSAWNYLSPFNECPPVPLEPQTINSITLSFQDETTTTRGIVDASCRFVITLKIREYDVADTRWGNSSAVNVRQMSIPTYNNYN